MKKDFVNILLTLAIVVIVGIGGYFALVKTNPINKPETLTPVQNTTPEVTTIQNINNAPPPTQANPSTQTTVSSAWKVFQDSRYTFQFNYPVKWNVGNQQGTSRVLILKDENNNEIITVDTGVNLAVIGISYCGVYPQDKRCEKLKTNSSGYVVIDWEVSGTANAMFSSQDGTYGVSFTLHKINSDTKTIFKKILSAFKFVK